MSPNRKPKRQQSRGLGKGALWLALAWGFLALILVILYLLPPPAHVPAPLRPPFEEPAAPGPARRPPLKPEEGPTTPVVAIIIDDMGYDLSLDRSFLKMEAPLSFAFLPMAPHTRELAREAIRLGKDVLVHLPLEPEDKGLDPGPGVLTLDMNFDSMLSQLREDLDAVPGAIGVNNHMGSRFTSDEKAMKTILLEIKRRGMFYIDSRTTKYTVAMQTALSLGIPAMERAVFLDHSLNRKAIASEIRRLKKVARERGKAIAIGHPHPVTLRVLYQMLPQLRKEVRLVPVHELVKKRRHSP